MPLLNTEAITLRRRRTRDADALVTLWGRSCGKIVASTRSVLKTSSRYAGITQPFNRMQVILYAKFDDQDIWTLTQASLVESYDGVQNDLHRISFASNLVEWIDALSGEFQSSERIWRMLLDVMKRWNQFPPLLEELAYYQLHLLVDAGLQPQLDRCGECQKTASRYWRYVVRKGGLICESCGREGVRLSGGAVEILRRLTDYKRPPSAIRMTNQQKDEIQQLLQAHGEYHAGLQSRSALFHADILKNNPNANFSTTADRIKEATS